MMREGATPSRLIHYLYSLHSREKGFHFVVMDYFEKAFSVSTSLIRISSDIDELLSEGYGSRYLNTWVLHLIFQNREVWEKDDNKQCVPAWMASLAATDLVQISKQDEKALIPDVTDTWKHLDERAKLLSMVRGYILLKERMDILAALSERLQRKLTMYEESVPNAPDVDRK